MFIICFTLINCALCSRTQAAYGPSDSSPEAGSSDPMGSIPNGMLPAAVRQEVEGGALLVAALTRCMMKPKRSVHSDLDARYYPFFALLLIEDILQALTFSCLSPEKPDTSLLIEVEDMDLFRFSTSITYIHFLYVCSRVHLFACCVAYLPVCQHITCLVRPIPSTFRFCNAFLQ